LPSPKKKTRLPYVMMAQAPALKAVSQRRRVSCLADEQLGSRAASEDEEGELDGEHKEEAAKHGPRIARNVCKRSLGVSL